MIGHDTLTIMRKSVNFQPDVCRWDETTPSAYLSCFFSNSSVISYSWPVISSAFRLACVMLNCGDRFLPAKEVIWMHRRLDGSSWNGCKAASWSRECYFSCHSCFLKRCGPANNLRSGNYWWEAFYLHVVFDQRRGAVAFSQLSNVGETRSQFWKGDVLVIS